MESFNCEYPGCFKQYKNYFNLKRHEEAFHAVNKKFQCSQCQKILSSRQNLKEHEFIHTKRAPFVCKELGCGQRFRHGSQNSAHKRIHTAISNILNKKPIAGFIVNFSSIIVEEQVQKMETANSDIERIELPKLGNKQPFIVPSI